MCFEKWSWKLNQVVICVRQGDMGWMRMPVGIIIMQKSFVPKFLVLLTLLLFAKIIIFQSLKHSSFFFSFFPKIYLLIDYILDTFQD